MLIHSVLWFAYHLLSFHLLYVRQDEITLSPPWRIEVKLSGGEWLNSLSCLGYLPQNYPLYPLNWRWRPINRSRPFGEKEHFLLPLKPNTGSSTRSPVTIPSTLVQNLWSYSILNRNTNTKMGKNDRRFRPSVRYQTLKFNYHRVFSFKEAYFTSAC
jgi:hypothetical protein